MHPFASAPPQEANAITAAQVEATIHLMTDLQRVLASQFAAEMVRSSTQVHASMGLLFLPQERFSICFG
jgi:hypothetical protein